MNNHKPLQHLQLKPPSYFQGHIHRVEHHSVYHIQYQIHNIASPELSYLHEYPTLFWVHMYHHHILKQRNQFLFSNHSGCNQHTPSLGSSLTRFTIYCLDHYSNLHKILKVNRALSRCRWIFSLRWISSNCLCNTPASSFHKQVYNMESSNDTLASTCS